VVPIIHTERVPRHRAFVEALAAGTEGSDVWRADRAGFVTLRLLDAWRDGHSTAAAWHHERAAVSTAIDAMPADRAERPLLATVLDRIRDARDGRPGALVGPVFAYARVLDRRSAWALAIDVYGLLWESYVGRDRVGPVDDEIGQSVAQYLGACHRMLGDHARATQAYAAAGALADARGDAVGTLRARLGRAKLLASAGDLEAAERALLAIVDLAATAQLAEVRAHAWHDLATIAHQARRLTAAIEYAYESWVATSEPGERQRVLVTLATLLLDAGYPDTAREANALLAETASEPFVRWSATVNLVELAAIERREIDFARYRRLLAGVELPPTLAGEYHLYVARGHAVFGQPTLAAAAAARAVAVAERHALTDLLARVRALGATPERPPAPAAPAAAPRPLAVRRVADALHGARLLAAAGA
jgi:tetratricopeptide (TPR) repeat protein